MTQDWQPIKTAPNDGRIVLLAGGRFFSEHRGEWVSAPFTAAWLDGCWLIDSFEGGYFLFCYEDPTHWMEIPESPK